VSAVPDASLFTRCGIVLERALPAPGESLVERFKKLVLDEIEPDAKRIFEFKSAPDGGGFSCAVTICGVPIVSHCCFDSCLQFWTAFVLTSRSVILLQQSGERHGCLEIARTRGGRETCALASARSVHAGLSCVAHCCVGLIFQAIAKLQTSPRFAPFFQVGIEFELLASPVCFSLFR
jgi:hypothetical protein